MFVRQPKTNTVEGTQGGRVEVFRGQTSSETNSETVLKGLNNLIKRGREDAKQAGKLLRFVDDYELLPVIARETKRLYGNPTSPEDLLENGIVFRDAVLYEGDFVLAELVFQALHRLSPEGFTAKKLNAQDELERQKIVEKRKQNGYETWMQGRFTQLNAKELALTIQSAEEIIDDILVHHARGINTVVVAGQEVVTEDAVREMLEVERKARDWGLSQEGITEEGEEDRPTQEIVGEVFEALGIVREETKLWEEARTALDVIGNVYHHGRIATNAFQVLDGETLVENLPSIKQKKGGPFWMRRYAIGGETIPITVKDPVYPDQTIIIPLFVANNVLLKAPFISGLLDNMDDDLIDMKSALNAKLQERNPQAIRILASTDDPNNFVITATYEDKTSSVLFESTNS